MSQGQLVQPYTSVYHIVTAGVITARGLSVLMETLTWEMMLFTQHQRSISNTGSSCDARKELAGTLTWKMMLLTQHQRKPTFACTYALPFSCLDAPCMLLLAALGIDLCCLPCVVKAWLYQHGHAVDFNNHLLYFHCAVCRACPAAQLA